MQYINQLRVLGFVGRDPVMRQTGGGRKVVSFSVATTDRYTTKDGEVKEFTEWHRVNVFSQPLCELIMERLKAGSLVYVEGQKRTREYTTNSGVKCRDAEIAIQSMRDIVSFLDSKADEQLAALAAAGFPTNGEDYEFENVGQ